MRDSFAGLTGTLVLSLPISLESVTLSGGEEGQAKQVAGSTVSLSSINGSDVNINYQGQGQNFLGILGFNAAGQELESMSRSILSDTGPVDTSLFIQFQGEPASVEVLVASDIVEKSYPFVIEPDRCTVSPVCLNRTQTTAVIKYLTLSAGTVVPGFPGGR